MDNQGQMRQGNNRINNQHKTKNQMIRERELQVRRNRLIAIGVVAVFFFIIVIAVGRFIFSKAADTMADSDSKLSRIFSGGPNPIEGAASEFPDLDITEDFLTVNQYSRPGTEIEDGVKYIIIHYTGNPGSTGDANRNYFESLKDSGETYASSHFVIGLDGEIIQCIPLNEMCYASNSRNVDSLAIECCHPDGTGNFNDATYNSCVYLTAALADYYDIDRDHIIRHYDVTGKICPKYFVDHEDRWEVFLDFVDQYRKK